MSRFILPFSCSSSGNRHSPRFPAFFIGEWYWKPKSVFVLIAAGVSAFLVDRVKGCSLIFLSSSFFPSVYEVYPGVHLKTILSFEQSRCQFVMHLGSVISVFSLSYLICKTFTSFKIICKSILRSHDSLLFTQFPPSPIVSWVIVYFNILQGYTFFNFPSSFFRVMKIF